RGVARRAGGVRRGPERAHAGSPRGVRVGGAGMASGAGPGHKLRYARAIAGGLAWLALRQGDPVGMVLGRDQTVDASLVRPRAGRERLTALAHRLHEAEPRGRCPWGPLLSTVAPRLPRRSLLVLVSDLLDPGTTEDDADEVLDELLRGLSQLRARNHDVVVVQTLHRDELDFPWADRGMLRFEDLRGLRAPREGPGRSLRDAYLRRLNEHLDGLSARCEAEGLLLLRMATDTPVQDAFVTLLGRLAGEPVLDESPELPARGRA
ncbi:MAG: hypothetical protein AB1Z98_27625, partial [Nannocystaceae bacterium]